MNFAQMQEHLRLELLRRIQRGTLSVSLLARQTGFGQSHLSNFLRRKRQLSLASMDRVLKAQHMTTEDLLPVTSRRFDPGQLENKAAVPIVCHETALYEPRIRPSMVRGLVYVHPDFLVATRPRPAPGRQTWDRFVAISIAETEAAPMEPVISPDAIVLLDRHYHSLVPYRPNRLNVYAVRNRNHLVLRYLDFVANRLVLRPHGVGFPLDLLEIPLGDTLADWIAGRIALVMNLV